MRKPDILALFDYNYWADWKSWANWKVVRAAGECRSSSSRPRLRSPGATCGTLVHTLERRDVSILLKNFGHEAPELQFLWYADTLQLKAP